MRLVVALVIGLAMVGAGGSGAPQDASPDITRKASAGPALAGTAVVWGERYADGSLAVVRRAAGDRPEVVHRIAAPEGQNGERHFYGVPGALSASSRWVAYGLDDAIITSQGGDYVSSELHGRAFGSRDGGPFADLLPQCGDAAYVSTAADGDALAIGLSGATCDGRDATWVWLLEGTAPPRAIYAGGSGHLGLRQVQIAGPYVAWSEGGSGAGDVRIRVARRADGAQVARLRPRDFGGRGTFSAFDIEAGGEVVALTGPQPRCYYVCVRVLDLDSRRPRTIARRAIDRSVAIDDGRVAYVSQRHLFARRLVVRTSHGRLVATYGRFGEQRELTGDLALADGRLAWSVLSGARFRDLESPRVRGRIRSERLPRATR